MHRYVALLRGINVGGHRVKMDRLRALFEELGFEDVSTFIASGNVIFSSAVGEPGALEGRIELHLADRLGYEVATFLRTPAELASVVAEVSALEAGRTDRGGGAPEGSTYVVFLGEPAGEETRRRLREAASDMDAFAFEGREVYWSIAGKLSESPLFGAGFERAMGKAPSTMRNATSLRRLLSKLEPAAGGA